MKMQSMCFVFFCVAISGSMQAMAQVNIHTHTVTTLAGSTVSGSGNGTGTVARFKFPFGVASDGIGNVFVADADNNMIRMITAAGVVTTLAGSTTAGSINGTSTAARFSSPRGVTVDGKGNLYIADAANNMIRKITTGGVVSTLAGSTIAGNNNGTGTAASFNAPTGIAVDASGNVYVADADNNMIRKISAAGVVTTLAGSTIVGSSDGPGAAARFNHPSGIAVDAYGVCYVADQGNNMIRKITTAGVVSTLAGNSIAGLVNGSGLLARFNHPVGIDVDALGNLYVGDQNNNEIRKVSATGTTTTIAGKGPADPGSANGSGTTARFNVPRGIAADKLGNTIYVGDNGNHMIRRITADFPQAPIDVQQ